MKRRLISAIMALVLMLSVGITAAADWRDAYNSGGSAEKSSGEKYLDDIGADIEYPKSSDYLAEYKTRYVKPSGNKESVYALHGLNDEGDWKKLARTVEEDTKVTVIAEHSYRSNGVKYTYSCCVYEEDGYEYAGWIYNKYLVTKSSGSGSSNSGSRSAFEKDLDDIGASIDYPKSSDYLDDYKIRYVRPSKTKESVYALHGLNDGGDWKKLAIKVESDTKVVVIAEHSYKSDGVKYTYSCCIFEIDGTAYAGWINNAYLVSKK